MTQRFKLASVVFYIGILFLGGCATSRGIVSLTTPAMGKAAQSNGKEIYLNSVKDERVFETKPANPDTPSLDPDEAQDNAIKSRALARKRNTWGKALGDILLQENQTVESVIHDALRQAFIEKGYRVIERKGDISNDTYMVDATIDKFWSWMNPGFWALTLSTEISTGISMKKAGDTVEKAVYVKTSDHFQTAAGGNWISVMQSALKSYIVEVKSKFE